ncbi:MAG: 16S rRNA (uracil(1498)-N(3))-methyltransferase [Acidobacteria bacterium]|nr:16S rRNA (uracil(1498)-N(3))-methyltransferase [Acidobacteriota bacterium]MBI3663179.1 16S rRNA (uracil(1498)-N(3))-methyltransferase [Acidobacteriota bacterium]
MRRRFFVDAFYGATASLDGEAAHHLGRVLRAEPGQMVELSDGKAVWLARVERVGRDAVEFALVEQLPAQATRLHLTLLLAIVKFDRFEWALEKATELGAGEIVPLAAARSEKGLIVAARKRSQRWERILLESAQQSRRLAPPVLCPAVRPADAFRSVGNGGGISALLSERADAPALRTVLVGKSATAAALAVGPEGGWTDEELSAARAAGFLEASLGQNILRTETAVAAALAILNYALGE